MQAGITGHTGSADGGKAQGASGGESVMEGDGGQRLGRVSACLVLFTPDSDQPLGPNAALWG